jgi:hypothetical protein
MNTGMNTGMKNTKSNNTVPERENNTGMKNTKSNNTDPGRKNMKSNTDSEKENNIRSNKNISKIKKNPSKITCQINNINNIKNIFELKKCYKSLALIYHPNKGGNTQKFQLLKSKYDKRYSELKFYENI